MAHPVEHRLPLPRTWVQVHSGLHLWGGSEGETFINGGSGLQFSVSFSLCVSLCLSLSIKK